MTAKLKSVALCAVIGVCMAGTGCATMTKTSVNLYGYTENMKVTENGVPLDIKLTYVGQSGMAGYSSGVTYYGAGVRLKRTKADHKILIEDGDKKVEVVLKSKFAVGTLLADIFLTGPIGIVVDVIAGPLKTTDKKHIDIQGELGNAPKKSKHKLKKEFKKSLKG